MSGNLTEITYSEIEELIMGQTATSMKDPDKEWV